MHLTPYELEIHNKIANSRILNPENISVKQWFEENTKTRDGLGEQFSCSGSVIKNLFKKLEVKRDLRRPINGLRKADLGSITRDAELRTELLKLARSGSRGSKRATKRLLTEFDLKLITDPQKIEKMNLDLSWMARGVT